MEETNRIKVTFKSISDPTEVIELQPLKEFFTEEEAEEFSKIILGILAPVNDAGRYKIEVILPTETSGSTTERPE